MAREACPVIPEPLCRMKRDAKHKPQVGGGWHPSFPDGCVRNSVTVSSARQLPVRAALRQNANACAFTLHRFFNLYYTRPDKKSQSAFCISFPARTPRLLWIFPAPRRPGMRMQGGAGRYAVRSPVSPSSGTGVPPSPPGGRLFFGYPLSFCNASQQRRSRLLAPRLGRGSTARQWLVGALEYWLVVPLRSG